LLTIGLNFLSPHPPRRPASPAQTNALARECLALTKQLECPAPVHHQEPFRRGYGRWEPTARDFLIDLRGAITGGAAGWCSHNGAQRSAPDSRPRRSFDMREKRLFEQLDKQEHKAIEAMAMGNNAVDVAGRLLSPRDSAEPTYALAALQVNNGKPLWSHVLPSIPAPWGLALNHEGRIVVTLANGHLICYARQ
jgi:hypothetical protein